MTGRHYATPYLVCWVSIKDTFNSSNCTEQPDRTLGIDWRKHVLCEGGVSSASGPGITLLMTLPPWQRLSASIHWSSWVEGEGINYIEVMVTRKGKLSMMIIMMTAMMIMILVMRRRRTTMMNDGDVDVDDDDDDDDDNVPFCLATTCF